MTDLTCRTAGGERTTATGWDDAASGGLGDGRLAELRARLEPVLGHRTEAFLAGGLAAVCPAEPSRRWVQVGLAVRDGHHRAVHAALAELAGELLAERAVSNFFFMHKPPGIRLRFEVADPGDRPWLRDQLRARTRRLGAHVGSVVDGVYEPEQHLFGGPASMPYVHRLFTVDSRAWLDHHQLTDPPPNWAFSLALVRQLFNGLRIAGWEDLDVWERIRRQAHRVLPASLPVTKIRSAGAAIRHLWADPERLTASLPGPAAELAHRWGGKLRLAAQDWHDGYFAAGDPLIGPREAAAFVTIFHWNRGALSAVTQALVAAALADRTARP